MKTALSLVHDRQARTAKLSEVVERHPNLSRKGLEESDVGMVDWDQEELRRTLLWIAACEPHPHTEIGRHSYSYKHRAEDATGAYVANGSLICAALMCELLVVPIAGSLNADIGLKSPVLTPARDHLMACQAADCEGACLLHNRVASIRAYRHPTLRELVGRAGFYWDELSPRVQRDLKAEHEADPYRAIEDDVSGLYSRLTEIAPEAHEAWAWCADCEEHHCWPCGESPIGMFVLPSLAA
ncbi:hypothetical protein [Candidatus Poriferisodalis sp.]|uniref:hypothetical protein n=1 Tax=Candidatus Poriferisodalis sp. TaxID=3101277 RepID=UPI003B595CBF